MNLSKSLEYFDPINQVDAPIHIIGVGAMGSRIGELLVRLGVPELHIWDMDTVEDKNITNQLYFADQIGEQKINAFEHTAHRINPSIKINKHSEYKQQPLSGYIFLAVDSIELRKKIVTLHKDNAYIKAMFDTRMRLEDAQSFAARWNNEKEKKNFIDSMDFTDEEASEATPVSACGTTLSVASTVTSTAAVTVANFMNLIRTNKIRNVILVNPFECNITAM